MKKLTFFGAAAVALMAATSANAQSGYVGGLYGNVDVDGLGDADFYGAEAAFGGSNFEVDLGVLDSDGGGGTAWSAAGHLFSRSDSHLFGGFVALSDDSDTTTWTAGVEGNKYFDNVTLAGAIAYASNDDLDADGYGINTEARFFPSENFRLQGNLGWTNVDVAGFEEDVISYGVGGEVQLSGMPISLALDWSTVDTDTLGLEADTIVFGVRYNFGGTLRDRDRTGASQASLVGLGF
jgi:hypothetical protein